MNITSLPGGTTVVRVLADDSNPFNGVKPSFNWLGSGFTGVWQAALGGFLGLALIALAFFFIKALLGLRHAMNVKKPQEAEHARNVMIGTGLGIIGVVLAPLLFVALTTAAGQS
jgi:hypothetical protein